MSDHENLDVGKIISLIMENPQLIEQISSLAKKQSNQENESNSDNAHTETVTQKETTAQASTATYQPTSGPRGNRSQLLNALKPYVSSERAKAIDSMMSIADILDLMKSR